MESYQPLDQDYSTDLQLSGQSRANLKETSRWAKFLAIVGFIGVGFMVLIAFAVGTFMSFMPGGEELPFPPAVLSVLYLGIAALYFFPVLYLYRFATKMENALRASSQIELEDSLANIKAHYKFMGILLMIMLGFYALLFLLGLMGGIGGALMG